MPKIDIIQWVEETRPLNELKPFEYNPRQITESQYSKLKESIEQDGYHSRTKCTQDGRIIGGHQRLRILKDMGLSEIQVLVPDREIDDDQFHKILLRDNHNAGVFDIDMLANYELELLHEIGLHEVNSLRPVDEIIEEAGKAPKNHVKCPECEFVFAVKGNKVDA